VVFRNSTVWTNVQTHRVPEDKPKTNGRVIGSCLMDIKNTRSRKKTMEEKRKRTEAVKEANRVEGKTVEVLNCTC
jgi:hypothetical protein